jgi:hypothetical protein
MVRGANFLDGHSRADSAIATRLFINRMFLELPEHGRLAYGNQMIARAVAAGFFERSLFLGGSETIANA